MTSETKSINFLLFKTIFFFSFALSSSWVIIALFNCALSLKSNKSFKVSSLVDILLLSFLFFSKYSHLKNLSFTFVIVNSDLSNTKDTLFFDISALSKPFFIISFIKAKLFMYLVKYKLMSL